MRSEGVSSGSQRGCEVFDHVFTSPATADHVVPRHLVTGDGAVALLGDSLRSLAIRAGPVLLVVDAALVDLAVVSPIEDRLRAAGYDPFVFSQIAGEPDLASAEEVVGAVRDRAHVAVVGVGGGSAMDPAKLAAGLATNEGSVDSYLRGKAIEQRPLPLALVPTTAGTGAEASKNTIVTHEARKFVIGSPLLCPTLALLDPLLTVSCPRGVTAASGMDALAHAVEASLSLWATPFTTLNALAAIRVIARWLKPACEDGSNLAARRAMLYSAYFAGLSINASTVLGHTMAYTVATRTYLPHGVTTAMTLPYCIAYNDAAAPEKIRMIASEIGIDPMVGGGLAGWLRQLGDDLGIPSSLRAVNIGESELAEMVDECLDKYPRPNNPAPFERPRLEAVYHHFLEGDLRGVRTSLKP